VWLPLFSWLFPLIGSQVNELTNDIPTYEKQFRQWLSQATEWYNNLPISPDVRQSIENSVKNSLGAIGSAVQSAVVGAITAVSRAMGFIVGLFIIPFWLFYVLKDRDRGMNALNNMLPRAWRNDVWRILRITNGVLSQYIRGQVILALAVGLASTIGMLIVGAPFPMVLGLISGITEIVPIIGPILGAVPGLILAAFHPEGWVMVLKVLAVYVVVQQLENNLLVPKIQGDSVKLHPALIMMRWWWVARSAACSALWRRCRWPRSCATYTCTFTNGSPKTTPHATPKPVCLTGGMKSRTRARRKKSVNSMLRNAYRYPEHRRSD
jgi:predicted PurR-regulated permease PerM